MRNCLILINKEVLLIFILVSNCCFNEIFAAVMTYSMTMCKKTI